MSHIPRRALLASLLGIGAKAAQQFGSVNPPQCPVCHAPVPSDFPAMQPVVADDSGISALPNVRDVICGNCGARFVVSV